MQKLSLIFAVILLLSAGNVTAQKQYSQLWGKNGEKWDKTKLSDFTTAGYREGKVAIPAYPNSVNIKDFGAVNDGITDNTAAFRKAINQCAYKGTLYIPAGKYVITDSLIIKKSGICIKGEGPGKTVLMIQKGLEELYPKYNPTRHQTSWSWSGAMILFQGDIEDSGIQDLTVQFPTDSLYAGHDFHERAYNGIGFSAGAHNGWVKNVTFRDADIGIWIEGAAHHITADGWILDFGPKRAAQDISAHHGVNIYGGHNLLQNFELKGKYVHDLSVESATSVYNVFRHGKGKDLCIDHHNHAQKHNLFTDLDAGKGTRLYHSGGNTAPLGISYDEVYWNITGDANDMEYCDQWNDKRGQAANNVAVGIKTTKPSSLNDAKGNWFETIDPKKIYPTDLYQSQMKLQAH
jgi:hypothetical protein